MTSPPADEANATTSAGAPPMTDDDLGFGRVASRQWSGRFLTRDGQSTSRKYGLGAQRTERIYLRALNMPWAEFLLWLFAVLLLLNGLFALLYSALGPGALAGANGLGLSDPFMRAFAYSVGVFTTTGASGLSAVGSTANWLTIVESLAGPIALVIAAGLLVARLTRPRASIRFSDSAVVAPYEGGRGLMFRIVNALPNELSDLQVEVSLSRFEEFDGVRERNFHSLALERNAVAFFPLHWTIVHPIDEASPLRGVTPEQLRETEAEFLILVKAHEDTFSTQITVRSSYRWDEITWDAKFASIFTSSPDGALAIDVERLSRLERLPEGTTREPASKELVRDRASGPGTLI